MIPQPLKWVGAVVALVIFMAVVGPMAYDSLLNMVTFSDEGGLIGGTDSLDGDVDEAGAAETEESEEEPAEDEPAEDPDPPESYVVQTGDTLFSIALEVYGDGARWPEIAEANDITDGTGITVGQELVIP